MNIHSKILKYKKASPKELRNFGLLMFVVVMGIFYGLVPFVFKKPIESWPFALACFFFFFAFFLQENLKWIYVPWMLLAEGLGWINGRLIMGIMFFLIITPMGLVARLTGKDLLKLKFDKKIKSYKSKSQESHTSEFGF